MKSRIGHFAFSLAIVFLSAFPVPAQQTAEPNQATSRPSQSRETEILEQISKIAGQAINSAQQDVEVVKWIAIAIGTLITAGGGLLGFLGFKSLSEAKDHFRKEAEKDAQKLVEVRAALARVLHTQAFTDKNYEELCALEKTRRSDKRLSSSKDEGEAHVQEWCATGEIMLKDLEDIRRWLLQIDSPRMMVWLEGTCGLTLHLLGRYSEAQPYLEEACRLARVELVHKSTLGSHLYNLACCMAMQEKNDAAIKYLDAALSAAPWYRLTAETDASEDGDFESLKTDPRFDGIIEKYTQR